MRPLFSKTSIALTVVSMAALLAGTPALSDTVPLQQPGKWAQDYVARPADPNVLFGTLPNGMRYAIMHNTTPSDGVAMRLRIGSGSIQESEEQQGLAHFLEHMAFRGSTNVADGDVVKILERQGLRFGPDTNAFTAQDETVYLFNFPKADAAAIDTGLNLFREIGGRLALASSAIDAERGVVLSEERLRDTPPYRATKANFSNVLHGTRAVERWPIGTVATIQGATQERLRAYYQANYRPDNATLIVVGNVDVKQVEKEIKARFSDWQPAAKAPQITFGTPEPVHSAVDFVAPGAPDQLWLSWVRPRDERAETAAVDREGLMRLVGLTIFNNRLSDAAAKAGAPFVAAGAGEAGNLLGGGALTLVRITTTPDKWQAALDAVTEEQRRLLEQGVSPAELKRAVAVLRTTLQNAADTAATRTSESLADGLVRAANDDQLYTSPAQDLAFSTPVLDAVTTQDAEAALKSAFTGKGPILFRSAQSAPATDGALATALSEAYRRPLGTRAADAAVSWPYENFGKAAAIVSQVTDQALGTTLVTFANGAHLLVKPTTFDKDKIYVNVLIGNGRAGATPGLAHALWATPLISSGGTEKLSSGQITQWLQSESKVVSGTFTAGTGAYIFSGQTRNADLLAQMQLLAAYAWEPGFRPELAEKIAAVGPMISGQVDANAGSVFFRGLQSVADGGDLRFATIPDAAQIGATKPGDVPALLKSDFAGPGDIVMVGDVTVADAIKAMQATFGAGPARAKVKPQIARVQASSKADAPWTFTHQGRADQAFFGEIWSIPDYKADPQGSHVADVAAAILRSRLVESVREKLGLTYSPIVLSQASFELRGLGYFGAVIETPAANFDTFKKIVGDEVADLATKPVSQDELERARNPLVENATKDLEKNSYWTRMLGLYLRDPSAKQLVIGNAAAISAVSAADVQQFMAKHIRNKVPQRIIAQAK